MPNATVLALSTTADRARARSTATKFCFTRMTDANSSSAVHFELHVVAAGEAVVAAVRAAAIRVQGPLERHPLDRGSAPSGRSLPDSAPGRRGAPPRSARRCRRPSRCWRCRGLSVCWIAEIEQERKGRHGRPLGKSEHDSLLFRLRVGGRPGRCQVASARLGRRARVSPAPFSRRGAFPADFARAPALRWRPSSSPPASCRSSRRA